MSILLTVDEVRELTGRRAKKLQVRWLRQHAWLFEIGADGTPKVSRDYFIRRLGGVKVVKEAEAPLPVIDYTVRRPKRNRHGTTTN